GDTCVKSDGWCPGDCMAGYGPERECIRCSAGKWGINCAKECTRHCKTLDDCQREDGFCSGDCEYNYYPKYACNQEVPKIDGKPVLKSRGADYIEIEWNVLEAKSNIKRDTAATKSFRVEYRSSSNEDDNIESIYISGLMARIDNLSKDSIFVFRVSALYSYE
ncbi:unnamed protein product, partial [Owenia fusiformis]